MSINLLEKMVLSNILLCIYILIRGKRMNKLKENYFGIFICLAIAIPSFLMGSLFPLIGGPIIAILLGMLISLFWTDKKSAEKGITWTSKFVLQSAVVLLGFGMNLNVVLQTGRQSLPIIVTTIFTALIIAWIMKILLKMDSRTATLIGVGSSICGGSAIAATASVLDADADEVAQSISVIFLFNVIAAILFPIMGTFLGLDNLSGESFGIFAGTAVNDTSSVTAAAATWDSMWNLGHATLDKAVTVKLTRTLAIIPITLALSFIKVRSEDTKSKFSLKKSFPIFILYFILASLLTTVAIHFGVKAEAFSVFKLLSKFFIIMAMAAIGLNSNIIKLIRTGAKPILTGAFCWMGITAVSLAMQYILGIW